MGIENLTVRPAAFHVQVRAAGDSLVVEIDGNSAVAVRFDLDFGNMIVLGRVADNLIFVNDFDNWGGGYVILGVAEKNGKPVFPVKGLNPAEVDALETGKVALETGSIDGDVALLRKTGLLSSEGIKKGLTWRTNLELRERL